MKKFRLVTLVCLSWLSLLTASGCSLFGTGKGSGDANLLPRETQDTYTVLLKGSKPETRQITEGMTVQGVVDTSKARKKFGNLSIVIKRVVPGKQVRHNLKVDFDTKKKRIPYDQDYTIHPNDIVLISPNKTNQLDKVVDALSGVIGGGRF